MASITPDIAITPVTLAVATIAITGWSGGLTLLPLLHTVVSFSLFNNSPRTSSGFEVNAWGIVCSLLS